MFRKFFVFGNFLLMIEIFEFFQTNAQTVNNLECAMNVPGFSACGAGVVPIAQANPLSFQLTTNYQPGSLMTWGPFNNLNFFPYCDNLDPRIQACLNLPGVRTACQGDQGVKALDFISYFCQRKQGKLKSF